MLTIDSSIQGTPLTACPYDSPLLDSCQPLSVYCFPMECTRCRGTGKEPDWRALGKTVREYREAKELGLREVARAIQVSASFLSDLELGRQSGKGGRRPAVLTFLELKAH